MSYRVKRMEKAFAGAPCISFEEHPKIVLMSDCHRGAGTWADSFLHNRPLYTAALKFYDQRGYTYIELGDGDELWENRSFKDIYHTHREIFSLFQRFHEKGKLFLLFGNHDHIKEKSAYVWKDTPITIPFYESLIIDGLDTLPIYLFHGYQGDILNDNLWKLSRWMVRYLWKPLELSGIKDPTSAAKNYTKVRKIEEDFIHFSCQHRCILVAGHTHKPTLMKTDCGMYFNSGSCVHPGAITAIELDSKKATLVKWSICSREDLMLYVCREQIKTMPL